MRLISLVCLLFISSEAISFGQLPDSIFSKLPNVKVGLNPDEHRHACELIETRAFGCQVHYVRTKQDYIIQVHRIVQANGQPITHHSRPVILQPGLTGSSTNFIIASDQVPNDLNVIGMNTGFELARRGYDVWLSNNRGNLYGMNHTTLSPDSKQFWEWSWDQISQYDTPAIIDYVRGQTNSSKVAYAGHSQGTAVMFALLSRTKDYDNIVEPYIAISPITRIGNATTTFRLLITFMKPLLWLGGGALKENSIKDDITSVACNRPWSQLCQAVFMSTVGFDCKDLNQSRLGVYMSHQPTSTSARNLLHFDQMFNVGKFAHYDFGPTGNLKAYGQLSAPEYNLNNITHPAMYVIYGRNDLYIPVESVDRLRADLTTAREFYAISNPKANHIDPLIGITSSPDVISMLLKILGQYD